MRKLTQYIPIISLALLLPGCARLQQGQGVLATVLDTVTAACAVYAPVAASLVTAPDPRISSLAVYGNAVCAPTGSVVAGFQPDAGTAAWVGSISGALRALASIQPVPVKPPVNG